MFRERKLTKAYDTAGGWPRPPNQQLTEHYNIIEKESVSHKNASLYQASLKAMPQHWIKHTPRGIILKKGIHNDYWQRRRDTLNSLWYYEKNHGEHSR